MHAHVTLITMATKQVLPMGVRQLLGSEPC